MTRRKWVIDKNIPRTPEERKWVENELSKERTPEELKKAILDCSWSLWFDKKISVKASTCPSEPEIYWKKIDEEGDYADSHFSEMKRAFIDQIKQNPQDWKIEEYEVPDYQLMGVPKEERKSKDLVVVCKNSVKRHYKNGFTKEEWVEIENVLNYQKNDNHDKESIIKKVEELCAKLIQIYESENKEKKELRSNIKRENSKKESEYRVKENQIIEKYLKKKVVIYIRKSKIKFWKI